MPGDFCEREQMEEQMRTQMPILKTTHSIVQAGRAERTSPVGVHFDRGLAIFCAPTRDRWHWCLASPNFPGRSRRPGSPHLPRALAARSPRIGRGVAWIKQCAHVYDACVLCICCCRGPREPSRGLLCASGLGPVKTKGGPASSKPNRGSRTLGLIWSWGVLFRFLIRGPRCLLQLWWPLLKLK
jgi:hypothetical protein